MSTPPPDPAGQPGQPPVAQEPPPAGEPVAVATTAPVASDEDARNLGVLTWLLGLFFSIIGPLIIWLIKRDESPFVDQTGKPGPSTWSNGTYPKGEAQHPVRGICWYEAAVLASSDPTTRTIPSGTTPFLVVPGLARPGRRIQVHIEYANTGNVDLGSPLFTIESSPDIAWRFADSPVPGGDT